MELFPKAHYNHLRQEWLDDPSVGHQNWEVADYRLLTTEELFAQLEGQGIPIDHRLFCLAAEEVETPEELAPLLAEQCGLEPNGYLYLLVFELWRRLLPEWRPISIFCDEIDYQIETYEQGKMQSCEGLEDALSALLTILEENAEEGINPKEAFTAISDSCAHSLEAFLYNFVNDLIEGGNEAYAKDLIDAFYSYIEDTQWFDLLCLRLAVEADSESTEEYFSTLLRKAKKNEDLDLTLETLSFLVQNGDRTAFKKLAKVAIPLLKKEEHFQDLLYISSDFFHCLDEENKEQCVEKLLSKRENISPTNPVTIEDCDVQSFLKLMRK